MENPESNTAVMERTHIALPPKYHVVFHNDNVTPMVFVVTVLKTVYDMDDKKAFNTMMEVHLNGKGIAGTYIKSVAETKVLLTNELSENSNFPLKVTIEEAS